jgi:hypothetical protein
MQLQDGLYRVSTNLLCAGFVVERGAVTHCAPILRRKLAYWMTRASRVIDQPSVEVDRRPPGAPTDQSKKPMSQTTNDYLVLVAGKSGTGKSASLMALNDGPNPEGVWYLNCEAGKKLPFRSKFKQFVITDPLQVHEAFAAAEEKPEVHTIVIDTMTYLLELYESMYVLGAADGQKAWGNFAQFVKQVMQQDVARSTKNVVFLAHTADQLNTTDMLMETKVPVKGSTKNNGLESYFSCVLGTKKMTLKQLEPYKSDLLVITPEEEALGFKHVFQTRITKDTVGERIRSPLAMWDVKETFIDNNMQLVFNRLREYYGEEATA